MTKNKFMCYANNVYFTRAIYNYNNNKMNTDIYEVVNCTAYTHRTREFVYSIEEYKNKNKYFEVPFFIQNVVAEGFCIPIDNTDKIIFIGNEHSTRIHEFNTDYRLHNYIMHNYINANHNEFYYQNTNFFDKKYFYMTTVIKTDESILSSEIILQELDFCLNI